MALGGESQMCCMEGQSFLCTKGNTCFLRLVYTESSLKSKQLRDSPGGPGVKDPPCNAGGMGSILDWGTKIPHAVEQLSSCVATRVWAPPLEGPCAAVKSPHGPKVVLWAAAKSWRSQIDKYNLFKQQTDNETLQITERETLEPKPPSKNGKQRQKEKPLLKKK